MSPNASASSTTLIRDFALVTSVACVSIGESRPVFLPVRERCQVAL